ncbi:hypothetical protein WN943_006669 [Citrus x changshan-huyou]
MPRDKGCGRIHALFPTYEILVIVRAFVLFWSSSVLSSEKEFFLGRSVFPAADRALGKGVKALNNHIIDIIGYGKTTGNGHSHTYGKVISNVKGGCPFKEEERQYEEEDKSKKARPPLSKSDLRKGFRQRRYESCLQAELLELPGPTSALELNVSSCCLARRGAKRRDVGTGR